MRILAENKERQLEDELSEAMTIIVQREAQVEALKIENDNLLKGKRFSDKTEVDLVENNARGLRAILERRRHWMRQQNMHSSNGIIIEQRKQHL